jgi:hypothetical protein
VWSRLYISQDASSVRLCAWPVGTLAYEYVRLVGLADDSDNHIITAA